MTDDLKSAHVEAAASNTDGKRRASFREDIERFFAEYTASLRNVLGFREVTEPPEQESTRSPSQRLTSPSEKPQKEADGA